LIITFSLAGGVAALLFPLARGAFSIVAVGILLAFFGIAVDPAIKVFSAEQYPTTLRGKGVALTEGVGRLLGGALAPYIMALVLANAGISRSFDFVAVVATVGALSVATFGRETKGLALEERALGSNPGINMVGEGTT
ncbi:MAG: MFS transporter, partial [Firmicutes bacterium]|nr:MFS transporter [Bacillota bacterium]